MQSDDVIAIGNGSTSAVEDSPQEWQCGTAYYSTSHRIDVTNDINAATPVDSVPERPRRVKLPSKRHTTTASDETFPKLNDED